VALPFPKLKGVRRWAMVDNGHCPPRTDDREIEDQGGRLEDAGHSGKYGEDVCRQAGRQQQRQRQGIILEDKFLIRQTSRRQSAFHDRSHREKKV
jgi:hypothetical protein